ncbi:MAG: ATP-grasp domain-containing protein, partial [Pyrinomonadaceae bacterium]
MKECDSKVMVSDDVRHLGKLLGSPDSDRIIALATSVVFEDDSLPLKFWGISSGKVDSGFQGHMYAGPNDILVVRVPGNDPEVPSMVRQAIDHGAEIWKSGAGIDLARGNSRIVLASDSECPMSANMAENLSWHSGELLEAAAAQFQNGNGSFLAFVFNDRVANMLKCGGELRDQAHTTSRLMDKNVAMGAIQQNNIACARAYVVDDPKDLDSIFADIPSTGRYVFKPAGGAAGIGVFDNNGRGAQLGQIRNHLAELDSNGRLPSSFQIQEFIKGIPFGISANIGPNGEFEIFEIHHQIMSGSGRFIGGNWTTQLQSQEMDFAVRIYRQLADIDEPRFRGLICLDIIDHKVIEVNPRLTASAPIAHLLRKELEISHFIGGSYRIKRIDLNTDVNIPIGYVRDETLRRLIENIWKERQVLVLPQGLSPFGPSRVVFVNDDEFGT